MVKGQKSEYQKYLKYVIVGLVMAVILIWEYGFVSRAEDVFEGYVNDAAGLLTEEEIADLNTEAANAYNDTEMEIYVLTIDDAEGKSAMEYADDTLFDWGYGRSGSDPVALILVDMDNREIYISTAGHMIDYLTDNRIETLTEDASGYLGDEEYYNGIHGVLTGITEYIDKGVPSVGYRYNEETGEVTKYNSLATIDIIIALAGGILLYIIIYVAVIRAYTIDIGGESYNIRRNSRFDIKERKDLLISKVVTHVSISKESTDHDSGQSSTHSSSGGGSFGGGGSSF